MKATTFLPIALAFTAAAEMQLYSLPTPAKRDLATVTSVVSQISNAIAQLDSSVKSYTGDGTQVQSDARALVSTIKDGASSIASAGPIDVTDILGLQGAATSLDTAGQSLLQDLEAKKAAFASADLCDTVQKAVTDIGAGVKDFVDAIVKQLPADAQDAARQFTSGISDKWGGCAAGFAPDQCKNHGGGGASGLPSSTAAACEGAVTVTVTAPCACESTTLSVPGTTPSLPATTPGSTYSVPITSVPFPTGSSNSTMVLPTGSLTTTSPSNIPTAGAGANGVGAVGLMAGLAAAMFV